MMLKKSSVFFLFLFIFLIRCNENDDTNEDFVPSKDWQPVRKGQKIPKGLHVRINLETGLTEAKLLDENEPSSDKNTALLPQESDQEPEKTIPKSVLKEAVKNIKDELFTPEDLKAIKDKYRSYEEIKKTLGDLSLSPKIDAEVIADLLKRHKEILTSEKVDQEQLLTILEDLDYLAHQYDNAREFVRQNGFHDVIYKNLNSTYVSVKKETLKLMAALMQNNVQPKIHALETGAVDTLLRLINLDSDSEVRHRALTALGALLRSFPVAQKKFVESGGLSVLSEFFDSDNIKIQIRLVTLISDLVDEHMFAGVNDDLLPYYINFDLTSRILEHDWCKKLNRLLMGLLITDKDDHDSMEKCLTAMHSLREKGHCGDKFDRDILKTLKKHYRSLKEENASASDDGEAIFFTVLEELCDQILDPVHTRVKTEL